MSGIKKRAACLAACFLALIFVFAQPLCAQAASVSAPLPEVRTLTYSEKETCKKELFLSARFADEAGTLLPYRYYLPEQGEDLPLIVFLHGSGERGTDNDRQLDNAILRPFLEDAQSPFYGAMVLAPQCPVKQYNNGWVDLASEGGWFTYTNYSVDKTPESAERKALVALIEKMCRTHPIDRDRIYLIGLSQGAVAVWDLLARHGELFAATVPIAGVGDVSEAERYADIPIYAFHGKEDPIIPYENATPALCEAIEACGKGKLNFVAFEDGAHDIWEQAIVFAGAEGLPALDGWLFSQRRAHTQNKLVYVIAGAAAAVLVAGIALSVFAVRSKCAKCASGG